MIFLSRGVLVDDCIVDRKVPNMATRTPREKFQAGKRMAFLFLIYHEMLKRNEGEAGKGLEKIVYRVVAESFQTRGMYFLSHPFEWCGPTWKQLEIIIHKNHTPQDEHDGNGEI